MNEVIKAMKERRSIRSFRPEMPEKEKLEQIIEAGLYAASGMGRQSSIIVVITNKEIRDRLMTANQKVMNAPADRDPFYGAPVIMVVLTPKEEANRLYDGSLVMGNLLLAAHAEGLGGIWIHRAKQEFEEEEWKQLLKDLGVEGEYEGIGHCAIGYIDGEIPEAAPRKENRVYWVE